MASPFTLTIDWLAFTVLGASTQNTMQVLGGEWIKGQSGFRGYPSSWICQSSARGIGKLGTGAPRRLGEVHVDLSAGIVSQWELTKVREVLQWVHAQQGHVTRMDCALDDRQTTVPLPTIQAAVQAGQCVTRAERLQSLSSASLHTGRSHGETLYFGSPQSQTMLRIYDKRLELQTKGREDWQAYGVRWELELKKERAHACANILAVMDEADWREFVVSLLRSYVDFRATAREEDDEDRYRAPLLPWWATLTEGFRKGRLHIEKAEPSLPRLKRWVSHTVAPSLAVICAADLDGQAWLEKQIVASVKRWKTRHLTMVKNRSKKQS